MKITLSNIESGLKKFSPEPLLEFIERLGMDDEDETGKEMAEYLSILLKTKSDEILHLDSSIGYKQDDPLRLLFSGFLDEFGELLNFPVIKRGGDMGDISRYLINPTFPLLLAIIQTDDSFEFYSTRETLALLIFYRLEKFTPYEKQAILKFQNLSVFKNVDLETFKKTHSRKIKSLQNFDYAQRLGLI